MAKNRKPRLKMAKNRKPPGYNPPLKIYLGNVITLKGLLHIFSFYIFEIFVANDKTFALEPY